MMKSFIEQARMYGAYHRKPITRYTHFAGVPLIIFSLMVLFGFLHLVIPGVMDITLASIATFALLIYYYFLNWRLALVLTAVFIILLWLANLVSYYGPTRSALWIFLITFILGWALQLIGHFFEGNRPAFLDNIWQALIAPMFLTAELFFLGGRMQNLQEQIQGIEEKEEPIHEESSLDNEIDKSKLE
ncbi:transmembrane protein [Legionella nautarum]|uniref:Transmembrane protein n=2 Tax=Legionella nautarum TaxID=45070 RepID=A0A0W0WW05_9GAMM|nr:transmembrane protein [Legionella nautarum]